MENGNPPKKKSKKKKVRSNSEVQASNGSDKQNFFFVGFSARSLRNICEQVDNTDIQPEVYSRLAEDATYKITEICNTIKNYAKHSGGRATFDIANEVLKDSNCAPIVGSDMPEWDSVEDDHRQLIFFSRDETLDLTEQFNKHITEENVSGPVFLSHSFLLDEKLDDDYIDFYQQLTTSVFTGDDECLDLALNILRSSPHIAGLVKHLLIKFVDMIAVNYSDNILDRSLKFLLAIIRNPYTCNTDMNIELKHICQLLVNLLVGSINDEIRENGIHENELEQETSEYSTYDSNIVSYHDGSNGIIDNNNGMNIDEMSSDSNMKAFDESNGVLMENFSMESEKVGRTIKDELTEGFETQSSDSSKLKLENHEEASKDSGSPRSGRNDIEDEFNALLSTNCASTVKCDDKDVEAICEIIGMCAAKWSGVENYLTILIISEVENFFKINKRVKSESDYDWLGRVAKGLWSLGEFAFRELLVFFEKIDTRNFQGLASFANNVNASAMYLRGKHDIFFYEFLYEVCGEKLMPFLLYYTNFILKHNQKKKLRYEAEKQNPTRYRISQRNQLVGYKIQRTYPPVPRAPAWASIPTTRPIVIQYGHPMSTKKLKKSVAKADEKREVHVQNAELLRTFNQRIVIAKGRLKKPITNFTRTDYLQSFHTLSL